MARFTVSRRAGVSLVTSAKQPAAFTLLQRNNADSLKCQAPDEGVATTLRNVLSYPHRTVRRTPGGRGGRTVDRPGEPSSETSLCFSLSCTSRP